MNSGKTIFLCARGFSVRQIDLASGLYWDRNVACGRDRTADYGCETSNIVTPSATAATVWSWIIHVSWDRTD